MTLPSTPISEPEKRLLTAVGRFTRPDVDRRRLVRRVSTDHLVLLRLDRCELILLLCVLDTAVSSRPSQLLRHNAPLTSVRR